MTKPTGRPRGRPKTKEYVTLMARVPRDMAGQVRRYASLRRQTISDVLRDGLLMLLQEAGPYGQYASDRKAASAIVSDGKKESSSITSDTKGDTPGKLSDTIAESAIVSDALPDFDPAKYVLGKLCPRGHDWQGAGQSLLRRSNRHCLACDREKFRERKQAQRG